MGMYGGFLKWGYPENGWVLMENATNMDDFQGTWGLMGIVEWEYMGV